MGLKHTQETNTIITYLCTLGKGLNLISRSQLYENTDIVEGVMVL